MRGIPFCCEYVFHEIRITGVVEYWQGEVVINRGEEWVPGFAGMAVIERSPLRGKGEEGRGRDGFWLPLG